MAFYIPSGSMESISIIEELTVTLERDPRSRVVDSCWQVFRSN